jgi:hypothetical protein
MKPFCIFPNCTWLYPDLLSTFVNHATSSKAPKPEECLDMAMSSFGGSDEGVQRIRDMFERYLSLSIQDQWLGLQPSTRTFVADLDDLAQTGQPEVKLCDVSEALRNLIRTIAAKRDAAVRHEMRDIVDEMRIIGKSADVTHRRTCDVCNSSKNL